MPCGSTCNPSRRFPATATSDWHIIEQTRRDAVVIAANRVGRREVLIGGIVHGLKSGGRDAPAVYGPRKTLYNRFVRWAAKGVCTDVFHALASAGGPPVELLIDSSAVTA